MTYIVEQKIKGKIYLYEVTSYWDKNKKQARQKRKYLGPKEKHNRNKIHFKQLNFVSKDFGDLCLLNFLSEKLQIKNFLKNVFPNDYNEILALSYYKLSELTSNYLFPYWQDEHYITNSRKLFSKEIFNLYDSIGKNEIARMDFFQLWTRFINPTSGIYYDITSISSYSTNIPEVEWGYNRDKESLPQINIGMTYCNKSSLPIFYRTNSGSIVDVKTLKNELKFLNIFGVKEVFFILDRGFCSKANILDMYKNQILFLQPLTLSLKETKNILKKNRTKLLRLSNAFKYKEEILHYLSTTLELDSIIFNAHIYYNEKVSVGQKQNFFSVIFDIEEQIKRHGKFATIKEANIYRNEKIQKYYQKFFKIDIKTKQLVQCKKEIENHISTMGMFIFILNNHKLMKKNEILDLYRNRDKIEKVFDVAKNEMDTERLRAHNEHTAQGRLFISFISLILHSQILQTIKKHDNTKQYTVKEILCELKKVKMNIYNKSQLFISETTKKQRDIFKTFDIDINKIHSY